MNLGVGCHVPGSAAPRLDSSVWPRCLGGCWGGGFAQWLGMGKDGQLCLFLETCQEVLLRSWERGGEESWGGLLQKTWACLPGRRNPLQMVRSEWANMCMRLAIKSVLAFTRFHCVVAAGFGSVIVTGSEATQKCFCEISAPHSPVVQNRRKPLPPHTAAM